MHLNIKYLVLLLLLSCNSDRKIESKELRDLIKTDNTDKVVQAYIIIGEQKEVEFIDDIFVNPYDPRISHDYRYYGLSVYQSKMKALRKISGLMPPNKLTMDPDSTIVKFYYKWSLENHYLKADVWASE